MSRWNRFLLTLQFLVLGFDHCTGDDLWFRRKNSTTNLQNMLHFIFSHQKRKHQTKISSSCTIRKRNQRKFFGCWILQNQPKKFNIVIFSYHYLFGHNLTVQYNFQKWQKLINTVNKCFENLKRTEQVNRKYLIKMFIGSKPLYIKPFNHNYLYSGRIASELLNIRLIIPPLHLQPLYPDYDGDMIEPVKKLKFPLQ